MTWYKVPYVEYGFDYVRTDNGADWARRVSDSTHRTTTIREVALLNNDFKPQVISEGEGRIMADLRLEERNRAVVELFRELGAK